MEARGTTARVTRCAMAFSRYGSFHRNPINIGIHIVCVPLLTFSGACLLQFSSPKVPAIPSTFAVPVLALPLVFLHIFSAFRYEKFCGAIMLVSYWSILMTSYRLYSTVDESKLWNWAMITHLVSWAAQFYGHFAHEDRKPAIFENVMLANDAFFFVVLEILFFMNYRPALKQRCIEAADAERARFQRAKRVQQRHSFRSRQEISPPS